MTDDLLFHRCRGNYKDNDRMKMATMFIIWLIVAVFVLSVQTVF